MCGKCGSRFPVTKQLSPASLMLSTGRQDRDCDISRHPRHGTTTRTRLAGEELDRAVAFYAGHVLADSTKRSYNSAKRRYHTFCTHNHITPLPLNDSPSAAHHTRAIAETSGSMAEGTHGADGIILWAAATLCTFLASYVLG